MTALLVLLGGAVGAPLRYLVDLQIQSRHDSVVPWGTFAVNVIGSFVLGVVAGFVAAHPGHAWVGWLVGTGVCGALTTFSTFSYETVRLAQAGSYAAALLNIVLSLTSAYAALALGWRLAF
ncbi:MAG: fluoride efflux transporter CrcB [Dermatophilaceae bacterium]